LSVIISDEMDETIKSKIEKLCKELGYKYDFIGNYDYLVVYGIYKEGRNAHYVAPLLINELTSLGHHVSEVYFMDSKLMVFFDENTKSE